mgnify:CR=1 FL=1
MRVDSNDNWTVLDGMRKGSLIVTSSFCPNGVEKMVLVFVSGRGRSVRVSRLDQRTKKKKNVGVESKMSVLIIGQLFRGLYRNENDVCTLKREVSKRFFSWSEQREAFELVVCE